MQNSFGRCLGMRETASVLDLRIGSEWECNSDSSHAGTSSLSHSKRTRQNNHPRLPPGDETAFSAGAHVNSFEARKRLLGC
ncbi:hypothetical protein Tco_1436396, partial [Tanacetum coccineum]